MKKVRFDGGSVRVLNINQGKATVRVEGKGDFETLITNIISVNDNVIQEVKHTRGIAQALLLQGLAEKRVAVERGHGSYNYPVSTQWSETVEDQYGHRYCATFEYELDKERYQQFDTKLSDKETLDYGENFKLDMEIKGATFRQTRSFRTLHEMLNPVCGGCWNSLLLPKTSDIVKKMIDTVSRFYQIDDVGDDIEKPIKFKEKIRCPVCRNKIKLKGVITPSLPTDGSVSEVIRKYDAWKNRHVG